VREKWAIAAGRDVDDGQRGEGGGGHAQGEGDDPPRRPARQAAHHRHRAAGPDGDHPADVGPEPPRPHRDAEREHGAAHDRRQAPGARHRAARRGDADDDQHRQDRLELVADPEEARPEPRVGAEERADHEVRPAREVDRVGGGAE
jgi:hypothetical protein